MALGEWAKVKAGIDKAHALCNKGGDWERKNKLKVRGLTLCPPISDLSECVRECVCLHVVVLWMGVPSEWCACKCAHMRAAYCVGGFPTRTHPSPLPCGA